MRKWALFVSAAAAATTVASCHRVTVTGLHRLSNATAACARVYASVFL